MKLPLRGLVFLIVTGLVLLIIKLHSEDNVSLKNSRDYFKYSQASEGSKELVQIKLEELANTIKTYFDQYVRDHEEDSMSKHKAHSFLMRHLTSELNDNISSENIKQIYDIVDRLRTTNISNEHSNTSSKSGYNPDVEVAMGRLSEHYKTAPRVDLDNEEIEMLELIVKHVNMTKRKPRKRDGKYLMMHSTRAPQPNWKLFQNQISRYELYKEDELVDKVLHDLSTKEIVKVRHNEGGTTLKLVLTFNDGSMANFKPMRFPRDWDAWPDLSYFYDFERHIAEIAAFHLDRLLEFRRVPPVVGRFINLTSEVEDVCDSSEIADTFFTSVDGNRCFYSECRHYCDAKHAICGKPHLLEGSVMAWLPSERYIKRMDYLNPWARTYSNVRKAEWETNRLYCDDVKKRPEYRTGRRLLDLMDLTIFDFLTGNYDRHHFFSYNSRFGNDSVIMVYDNGQGFGRSKYDMMSILVPVIQCCLIRFSTFEKLLRFEEGDIKLSDMMRKSLEKDPISPILTEDHLLALDRRVRIVLKEIIKCFKHRNGTSTVVIDDGF